MAKKEAHHGGAWKVAYADFVTAMMALFMVLWISAQDKKILLATSHYFQQPFHSPFEDHSGIMPFNKELKNGSGADRDDSSSGRQGLVRRPEDRAEFPQFRRRRLQAAPAGSTRTSSKSRSTSRSPATGCA
jgi:flagellar motor protein MotB